MKKAGFFMVLIVINFSCLSQTTDFENLDLQKVKNDIDTIKQQVDSTFFYIDETYKILKEEVDIFGLRKTILINFKIFFPYIIILGIYILWLFGRTRRKYKY